MSSLNRLQTIADHLQECSSTEAQNTSESLNTQEIFNILETDNLEMRKELRELQKGDLFLVRHNLTLEQQREITFQRLRKICSERKYVSVKDFLSNPLRIFAAHEAAAIVDPSLSTKMTVQFNLFGGTLLKLGTERHHRELLDLIDSCEVVGCFALTELGFGNNAVEMETTATYDKKSKEFIINCPTLLSHKYWITNSAVHAHYAIVFARLLLDDENGKQGGRNEGVHAFLVPIRDRKTHKVCEGVTIEDMGQKIGLNGVDNGRLIFKNVRIPLGNLLDRFSQVSEDGTFQSEIKSKRGRFLKVADQLLSGRICIACMMLTGAKGSLSVATAYSSTRYAVGPSGKSDRNLLSFQLQQKAFLPLLARTYAYHFGLATVKNFYARVTTTASEPRDAAWLVVYCCAIKPLVTWHACQTSNLCRERCGGQGYLACNRFGEMIAGSHAGITAEGDNAVLMQKVAKELLALLQSGELEAKTPSHKGPRKIETMEHLLTLLEEKEGVLLQRLARIVQESIMKGDVYEEWSHRQNDLIQLVSASFGEKFAFVQFLNAVKSAAEKKQISAAAEDALLHLVRLFATESLLSNVSVLLDNEAGEEFPPVLVVEDLRSLRRIRETSCSALASQILPLTQAFGIEQSHLQAPILTDWELFHRFLYSGESHDFFQHNLK